MPVQIASMLFEVMKKNTKPRHRAKLHENFKDLLEGLEGFTQSGESVVPKYGPLNFAKHEYTLPDLTLPEVADEHISSDIDINKLKEKIKALERRAGKSKKDGGKPGEHKNGLDIHRAPHKVHEPA